MDSDRDEFIIHQIALLKKKERQRALKRNALFLGSGLALMGLVFCIRWLIFSTSPKESTASSAVDRETISVEEISQPPSFNGGSNGRNTSTSVANFEHSSFGDSTHLETDTIEVRR